MAGSRASRYNLRLILSQVQLVNRPLKIAHTSDVHLHDGDDGMPVRHAFAEVVDTVLDVRADLFLIAGDLFDHTRIEGDVIDFVYEQLSRVSCPTVIIAGNHDEFARDYAGRLFGGIEIINEAVHETADGRRLLVLHGDRFDGVIACAKWLAHLGDWAYGVALAINDRLFAIRKRMGLPYWSLSAWLKHKVKNAVEYISRFEDAVAQEAARRGVDGVVCGHIHHAEIRRIGPILYLNDGDWVESCTALVEDARGNMEILRWRTEAPKPVAAAVSAGAEPGAPQAVPA